MTTQEIKLSEKERELIRLHALDYSIKEIAKALLTTHGVVHQMNNELYRKVGCKKSKGLVHWANQNGIL